MNVFLIDADNLNSGAWVDEAFRVLEASEGPLPVRRAYGSAENLKGLSEVLRAWAVRPFVNLSLTKNTTDIALAVDAMEFACQTPAPGLVVIGSGDADFVPLVVRLRERGIRMVCVSERSKMGREAVSAYDRVILVGPEQALHEAQLTAAAATIPAIAPAPVPVAAPIRVAPQAFNVGKKVVAKKAPVATLPQAIKQAVPISAPTIAAPAASLVTVDDPKAVRSILAALPAWLPNTIMQLNQLGSPLRESGVAKGNKPLHELFRKHPAYFKVLPTTGAAKQVRLLKTPL